MAKATLVKKEEANWEPYVTLELSKDEATILRDLIGWKVIGKENGRKRFAVAIHEALSVAGVAASHYPHDMSGSIDFK